MSRKRTMFLRWAMTTPGRYNFFHFVCFVRDWSIFSASEMTCYHRTRVRWLGMLVSNSLTDSLTNCCLVILIDVGLACEDANSKLVEVVTVAHDDAENHVGNNLLQIWELTFGPKAKLLFRLWAHHKVGQDFEVEVQARFWSWSLFIISPLMFCRGYEVEPWSRFWG